MKQNTCIGVMVIESTFALISMGLLFSDIGTVIYPISLLIFAAVLAPFYIRLREESDEAKKRKIRRNMALVLLIPIVIAVVMVAVVVTALMIYFSA